MCASKTDADGDIALPDAAKSSSRDMQSFINVIFKVITYSTELEKRLAEVLELVAKKFKLAEASVGVLDDVHECLRTRYSWHDSSAKADAFASTAPYADFPATVGVLLERKASVYSPGPDPHPDEAAFRRAGVGACIIYPLVVYDNVFGYLSFSKREVYRWTESDKSIFGTISYIVESILQRLEMEKEIRGANALMNFVLKNSPAAIAVFEAKSSRLIYANSNFRDLRGIGDYVDAELADDEGQEHENGREVFLEEQGKWVSLRHNHAKWTDGRDVVVCSATDITTIKRQAAKIEQLALYDSLLGIPNRAKFERDLPVYFKSEKGALIFVDLDNFKSINDSYSHAHGDNLLRQIALFLHDLPRHGDVYRYGGDEFVIIADQADLEEVQRICAMIIERCKKPWTIGPAQQCYCTASLGAALYPDDANMPEDIVKCADIAVFRAKALGKNTLSLYTPEMNADFLDQAVLEMHMRQALNEDMDGFDVYYQPIMDKNGKCAGAEAVLRWQVDGLGVLKPAEFVPLAEYLGLIDHIGDWLLAKACAQCKIWNQTFDPDFFVSLFLSSKQMRANTFIATLRGLLQEHELRPRNLVLEVTEADKERELDFARKVIDELNSLGVTVAISGFGAGFISFLQLRALGIDIVKMGPDIVKELPYDPFVSTFLHSMVELLHGLSRTVCLKGIESDEQLAGARQTGADFVQGYHFAHAESVASFEEKFLKR